MLRSLCISTILFFFFLKIQSDTDKFRVFKKKIHHLKKGTRICVEHFILCALSGGQLANSGAISHS